MRICAGGDAFYIIGIGDYDDAEIAQRIAAFKADMQTRSSLAAKPYPLTASIDCCIRKLRDESSVHEAIREADAAIYRYKTQRRRHRTE